MTATGTASTMSAWQAVATIRIHTGAGRNTRTDMFQNCREYVWDNRADVATLRDDGGRTVDTDVLGPSPPLTGVKVSVAAPSVCGAVAAAPPFDADRKPRPRPQVAATCKAAPSLAAYSGFLRGTWCRGPDHCGVGKP
ncbi:hypothetical protein OV450_8385 [Actinobacteria bacterium OV450]|nr:hypothetical protein OV450_8385 [Actinobacteria bacterium OV450]